MGKQQRYDVVILGGGPNGLGIAAYLGKCGLKVCICEARLEVGGGCETIEPIPGFRIDPHATYNYAGASPAWEQLELYKYGMRTIVHNVFGGGVSRDFERVSIASKLNKEAVRDGMSTWGKEAAEEMTLIYDILDSPACRDFLRSIFWTPPPPDGYSCEPSDLPWVKTIKQLPLLGDVYDDSWLDMSTLDIANIICSTDIQKVGICMAAWDTHPDFISKGLGIVGLADTFLIMDASGSPLGGMHSYMHAIARCAVANRVTILTNSPVEEIIIEDGEAKGVRLADTAPPANKVIYADKAVISNTHVQQAFLKHISPRHLDRGFLQRVKDININGGSVYKLDMVVKELPRFKGKAGEYIDKYLPASIVFPMDGMDVLMNQRNAVNVERRDAIGKDEIVMRSYRQSIYDPTRCPPGYHIVYNYIFAPTPEYHRDGIDAGIRDKDKIVDAMLQHYRDYCTNMDGDNIVAKFPMSPREQEFRNMGFIAGNFQGIRSCEDQWCSNRPLPELGRYRTPIHNLYLCNHTSYPGALALMAVPYNLMHILIEDRIAQPGDWWYPSPYYVSEREVKTGEV